MDTTWSQNHFINDQAMCALSPNAWGPSARTRLAPRIHARETPQHKLRQMLRQMRRFGFFLMALVGLPSGHHQGNNFGRLLLVHISFSLTLGEAEVGSTQRLAGLKQVGVSSILGLACLEQVQSDSLCAFEVVERDFLTTLPEVAGMEQVEARQGGMRLGSPYQAKVLSAVEAHVGIDTGLRGSLLAEEGTVGALAAFQTRLLEVLVRNVGKCEDCRDRPMGASR